MGCSDVVNEPEQPPNIRKAIEVSNQFYRDPDQSTTAPAVLSGGSLPPLSREALRLRMRLAELFLAEEQENRRDRLIRLVERANKRFERREAGRRREVTL